MAQLELPFSELVVEDFKRGWIHFKFVARAKEWNKEKQRAVIPALLRELFDYYVDLNNTTKGDLKLLRAALEERAGKKEDALAASRSQGQGERMSDFASSLKQLFKSAFSAEAMTSSVLLQSFNWSAPGHQPSIIAAQQTNYLYCSCKGCNRC